MKSAIEEHGLGEKVIRWWKIQNRLPDRLPQVIDWLHGAGIIYPDEAAGDELIFLSRVLYEKRVMS